jgi:PEP-CTERM motif
MTRPVTSYIVGFSGALVLVGLPIWLTLRPVAHSSTSEGAAISNEPTTESVGSPEDSAARLVVPRGDFSLPLTNSSASDGATPDQLLADLEKYLNGQAVGPTRTNGDNVSTSLTDSPSTLDASHGGVNGFAIAPGTASSGAGPGAGARNRGAGLSLGTGGGGNAGGSLSAQEVSSVPIEEVATSSNDSETIAGDEGLPQQNGDTSASSNGSGTIAGGVDFTTRNGDIPVNVVELDQSHPSGDDEIGNVGYGNPPVKQIPEPSSLLLVALGIVGFRATRNRMNKRQR